MRCTHCQFENPAGARFCEACGQRLAQACPQCGYESSPSARFCAACGAQLPDPVAAPQQTPPPAPPVPAPILYTPPHLAERIRAERAAMEAKGADAAGERKTITALFADMAGSTALIQDLDPEEARRLIDPVVALMMEAVHHYEGYVAKSLGDGILALFGAPIAHEDHALRALFAALRMQQAMRRHSDRIRLEQGIPLQIRVGVHTGEVVVRSIRKDDLRTDYDPVGHTMHIAARMEGVATPSSILVSESTHRLTEGYFAFQALGRTQIKGLREPLAVYEVLGLGALRTRLQVGALRGLARFVGREAELARLGEALALAKGGQGQIVGVVGEAGVGKSRLFHEFKARAQEGCLVLETFSVSHGKAFPYLPLIDLLRNYFQITPQDDERRCREKATGKLLILDRALEEHLPYLLYLLGIVEPGSALPTMDPAIRRRRTFEAIVKLLVRESQNQMLMVLFEDLQWLDSETEAFLDVLIAQVPHARLLLLVNYRPEYRHDGGSQPCYTQLHLEPLGPAEAQGLLMALLGDDPSLVPLKQLILSKTEGNPFFMEEVVQTLAEEHALLGQPGHYRIDKAPVALHIPTTVQGVLAARIDRLPVPQKELLQTLAVIGTEFPSSLVRHVTGQPEAALHPLLVDLQAGDFIYERPAYPEVEYAFKHALTQEVAGNSLLSAQRSLLHERTAQAIEALFPDRLKEYCNELAHHYSQSGNVPKAVEYLQLAGKQALQRSAQLEAIGHLSAALELLKTLPDTPERLQEELTLLLTLGPAWMAARGFGAPEVEATYTRALALSKQGGDTPQCFSSQLGLWSFYLLRAQLKTAQALGERLLSLAQDTQDPEQMAEAHRVLGSTVFRLGEFTAARTHMEQALALHRPDRQSYGHLLRYVRNPAVHMRSALSWALWYLGLPDQSLARSAEALALARQASDPFGLALSLIFAAELHQRRGEPEQTLEYANAALALSSEQGFPLYLAWATILRGWALGRQGSHEEGIDLIQQGLAAHEATGAALGRPSLLGLLADAYGRAGQPDAALRVLGEALTLASSTGECFDAATLHRFQGEWMLQLPGEMASLSARDDEAQACFEKAIALAHQQAAKSIELQAVLSVARLWHRQGKDEAARQMVVKVHASFTEGFDTVDARQASELLTGASPLGLV
ncbi:MULTISPECIES: adenylate/guanylate cyclase domain-containing protein [unclassified Cupriavidus]|uniref:adenylate/guanylate cyclase domain-containing protein n=1 Tax=unclassified Cupriavidus TaxID=2640874 RepID=UPI001AE2BD0B|nr:MULTISPECIES: adenylate/guanylate cyclase domain-containing protein [unclassified Cupriavidus]MBP0631195.1 AAA family ATPase [Cupriavidus sp. AcVe19-1a]MBP0639296.1 AAA family ATPase [Cupriavidus sp. AcVe19-6a]